MTITTTDSTEVVTNPLIDATSLVEAASEELHEALVAGLSVSEEDIRGEIEGVQQALDSLLFAADAADFEASVPEVEAADA